MTSWTFVVRSLDGIPAQDSICRESSIDTPPLLWRFVRGGIVTLNLFVVWHALSVAWSDWEVDPRNALHQGSSAVP